MRSILLFSAGLDSTVILYDLVEENKSQRNDILCLIIDYGQKNDLEIGKAILACELLGVPHVLKKVSLPNSDNTKEIHARNVLFMSYGLMIACNEGYDEVVIGSCKDDISIDAQDYTIDKMRFIFKVHGKELRAPLLTWTKKQILRQAIIREVRLEFVHPCRENIFCGKCRTCELTAQAAEQLGVVIPEFEQRWNDGL